MSDSTSVIDPPFLSKLASASDVRSFDVRLTFVSRARMESLYNQLMSRSPLKYENFLPALGVNEEIRDRAMEVSLRDRYADPAHFKVRAFKERIKDVAIDNLAKDENNNQPCITLTVLAAIARMLGQLSRELGLIKIEEAEFFTET